MKDTNLGKTFRDSDIVSNIISTVKTFDISGNNIWYMNEFTFNASNELNHLILMNNILLEIPIAVSYLETLETLDIRFNQLQSINETMRSWMENDNIDWIKNELIPKVENSWNLKICIEHRDILLGDSHADALANATEMSTHVIIIISENHKDYPWGRLEIERAKLEKFTKYLQKIMVIMRNVIREDIPLAELAKFQNDVIIIDWYDTESTDGWNKLRLTLFTEY
ncbi:TLR6 [Mytilus coruscus]|uniref:TLR6 n=1 Tax=Mytilus coruscus TaxID=42192 RepID=A0A6J8E1G4_MYTCO|nr:TLR6 [Mytilus coruscus]